MILPLFLLAGKLLTAAFVVAAVGAAVIAFVDLLEGLRRNKVHQKDVGVLTRTLLDNGQYRVVGSVFSNRPLGVFPRSVRHSDTSVGALDAELQAAFAGKDRVRIQL